MNLDWGLGIEHNFQKPLQLRMVNNSLACCSQVWNACGCRNLGDYHDIYLKSDVYLLADVFENFCSAALSTYGLDPAHYFTLPGFSWDALLKTTGIELQLFTDVDMHLYIERGKSCVFFFFFFFFFFWFCRT